MRSAIFPGGTRGTTEPPKPPNQESRFAQASKTVTRKFNASVGPAVLSVAVNSLVNLIVVVIVAQKLNAAEMGLFLLAYSTIVFVTGFNQALNVEPLVLVAGRNASILSAINRRMVLRSSAKLGLIVACMLIVIMPFLPSEWAKSSIVLCILLPFALVLDANRGMLQAGSKGWSALRLDAINFCLLGIGMSSFAWFGKDSTSALICYSVPIALTSVCVFIAVENLAKQRTTAGLANIPRKYRIDLSSEFGVMQGANQAILYSTPAYLSLAETAGFRGVQVLFGPMNIVFTALRVAVVPRISLDLHQKTDKSKMRIWISHGWTIVAAGAVFSLLLVFVGNSVGAILLGETWEYAKTLVLPIGVQYFALAVISFSMLMLRATARTSLSLAARVIQSVLAIAGGICAWQLGELSALGWALAITTSVSACVWISLSLIAGTSICTGGNAMRILHIVPLIGTNAEYGGPARGTMRQADALTENGHTVSVLSLWRGAKPTPEASSRVELVTFAARSVPGLPGFGGLFSFKALRWLRANATKFEIVHIHGGRELWVLLASIILRNLKISYVVQTHGMLNRRDNRKIVWYDRFLTKPAYSHASALLYLTNFEQRRLKEFDWMPKTELLLNGVDAPDIIVPPAIENSELRVVTTARIHPRKHIPDLVDAIAILLDKGVDVSLDIYGPDEGDVDRILKKIEERNLGNAIKYRGALSYTEIRNVLREYNTYVLPSRHEPFPNSLLEALASGLASICTEECGLAPYIVEGKAGLVVEHGPKGISEALLRLSAEPRLRRQLGEAALTLCDSTFSMIAVRERIEEIYSEQIENENKVMRRA